MSKVSSKKIWAVGVARFSVGDRFQSKWDKSIICTLVKIREAGKKPYTVEWDNKRRVHCDESWFDDMKFLEETECNLHNLTSAQELAQVTVYQDFSTDLSSLEPQRLTITAQTSLNCDIQELTTMETCKVLPILEHSDCDPDQLISFPLPHPAPHFPQKAIAGEQPMSETVSPQSLKLLASTNQNSQQLKTSQVCSLAPTSLEMSAVTSGMFYSSFPPSGMMRTGLLSEAATLALPSLEKEYCWLPSPGALSFSGKGRPPGQTKQEGGLKDLGLLQKGEVLNPDILCEWYGLPPNWLDPSESRAATELLENNERQQEICLTPELQRSPCVESSILISCPSCQQELLTLNDSVSGSDVGASGCGVCGWIPENFLEESKPQLEAVQKPKGRQRKGCLYKYIENKKLKSGAIASYPRVIGHRNPDNPTHWRWGFNWEEKIDGEWKGRSIGSVPLGAIALIQSMQNEGISLEEIIGFIRRAKSKKC